MEESDAGPFFVAEALHEVDEVGRFETWVSVFGAWECCEVLVVVCEGDEAVVVVQPRFVHAADGPLARPFESAADASAARQGEVVVARRLVLVVEADVAFAG